MVCPQKLFNILKKNKINFFCGVPDSILNGFTNCLKKKHNLTTSNEGAAIAVAVGNYLSSKKLTCVYLQNSGLGNTINPLLSIAHKKVYSIPIIMLIGWRGHPNHADEEQHLAQGKITKDLLRLLNIKFIEINKNNDLCKIKRLTDYALKKKMVVAILIKEKLKIKKKLIDNKESNKIDRSFFLKTLLSVTNKKHNIISSTGYISRDLFKYSKENNQTNYFYNVGGMGHTNMIALGISNFTNNKTICIDGDGSLIMHMGSLPILANSKKKIKYILLNNQIHESVGGQECISSKINFKKLSESTNFEKYFSVNKKENLKKILKQFLDTNLINFLEVKMSNKNQNNLPRVKNLYKIKKDFMKKL